MKRLFLFNEGSRASKYGIGKYIEQLINCLVGNTYISLNVVCFNSGEKELVIESHDGYMLYLFPHYVDQAGLDLMEIPMPLPPKC